MERPAGITAQRFESWSGAIAAKQTHFASVLIDFDRGFSIGEGGRQREVITAQDVLGSRAQHLNPMAKPWLDRIRNHDLPKAGDVASMFSAGSPFSVD